MPRPPCFGKTVVKTGPWTAEEDEVLIDYIGKHGCGNWRKLPEKAGLNRCGKSCRLRWTNYLRPEIKRGGFSPQEEATIISLHKLLGNKWSKIAAQLPGRTDNEIKNFWNTHLRKKLLRCGIDPITHTPITDQNLLNNLFSPYNVSPMVNPSFNLQENATQLAKIQLLQNILEIVSLIQLQFYGNNFHLGGPLNQETFLNSRIHTCIRPSYIAPSERELLNQGSFLDPVVHAPVELTEQLYYDHMRDLVHPTKFVRDANLGHEKRLLQSQGTLANLENINVHVMRTAKSFKGFNSSNGFVPSLVQVEANENPIVKQHENISKGVSTDEIESMIDSWEKFLDDEASTSFFREILA